jgi:rod shape determining protein RodA
MGAQRWLDLGLFQIQPSEIMKIALVLALARYFHGLNADEIGRVVFIAPPALMVLVPAALVMRQPDLGTAALMLLSGAAMFFADVRVEVRAVRRRGRAMPVPGRCCANISAIRH